MEPIMSGGTGDPPLTVIGKKGALDGHHATTINIYHQYFGIPIMIIHAERAAVEVRKI